MDPLRAVRVPVRAGLAVGLGSALAAVYNVEIRVRPVSDARRDRYVGIFAQNMLRFLGADLVLPPGWQRPPVPPQGRMVLSNHRSSMDIVVLLHLFGGHLLSRHDVRGWPGLGALARWSGTLFVERDKQSSRIGAVRVIAERLGAGRTVCVFPEGTTYPDDEVRPFHPGVFLAPVRCGSEVQPVGLAYADPRSTYYQETFGAHGRRLLEAPATRLAVAVGTPFSAQGLHARDLCERAHADVQALVRQARTMLG